MKKKSGGPKGEKKAYIYTDGKKESQALFEISLRRRDFLHGGARERKGGGSRLAQPITSPDVRASRLRRRRRQCECDSIQKLGSTRACILGAAV